MSDKWIPTVFGDILGDILGVKLCHAIVEQKNAKWKCTKMQSREERHMMLSDTDELLRRLDDSFRNAGMPRDVYNRVKRMIRKTTAYCFCHCDDCMFFKEFAEHDDELVDGYCDYLNRGVSCWGFCYFGERREAND